MCDACYHCGVTVLEPGDRDPAESGTACYEFIPRGRLDPSWSDWFGGLQLRTTDDGHTLLIGVLPDQSALHAVLARIRARVSSCSGSAAWMTAKPPRPVGER